MVTCLPCLQLNDDFLPFSIKTYIMGTHVFVEKYWQLSLKFSSNTHLNCFTEKSGPPHDKTNKMTVRSAKTQISLSIRPVWLESSLCAKWVAKDPSFLHADSEDSDQTGRMPMLIWVFAGRTCHFVGFVTRRLICLRSTTLLMVEAGKSQGSIVYMDKHSHKQDKKATVYHLYKYSKMYFV